MIGSHRPCWLACVLVTATAALEVSLGICVMGEVNHAALAKLYVALGLITLLGLACVLQERT